MNSNKIINCADPTLAQDVATKNYVDNAVPGSDPLSAVLLIGNSAGGSSIDMNGNLITNLLDPVNLQDATTKSWVLGQLPPPYTTPTLSDVLTAGNTASGDINMNDFDISSVNDITMSGLAPTITATNILGNMTLSALGTFNALTGGQMTLASGGVMSIGGASYTTIEDLRINNNVITKESGALDITIDNVATIQNSPAGSNLTINAGAQVSITTGTGDLILNPSGSVDCNGKTVNMTGGEIHNCPLIHSQNNQNITIEGKGTGDIVFIANTATKMTIPDTGSVSMGVGIDMNNLNITECNTLSGNNNTNLSLTALGTGDIILTANGVAKITIPDSGDIGFSVNLDMNTFSVKDVSSIQGINNGNLGITAFGTGDIVMTANSVVKMTIPDTGDITVGANFDMNTNNINDCSSLAGTSNANLGITALGTGDIVMTTGGSAKMTIPDTGDIQVGTNLDMNTNNINDCSSIAGTTNTDIGITALGTGDILLVAGGTTKVLIPNTGSIQTINIKPNNVVDINNSIGTAGQVLSATGVALDWIDSVNTLSSGTTNTIVVNTTAPATTLAPTLDLATKTGASAGTYYTHPATFTLDTYGRSTITVPVSIVATGGTTNIFTDFNGITWKCHLFTTVGTTNFVVSNIGTYGRVDVLLIGGGGSGASNSGGVSASGAGAGEVVIVEGQYLASGATTYPVVVGDGGAGVNANPGINGSSSSFNGIISAGGNGGRLSTATPSIPSGTLPSANSNTSSGAGAGVNSAGTNSGIGTALSVLYNNTAQRSPIISNSSYTNAYVYSNNGGTAQYVPNTYSAGGGGGAGAVGVAGTANPTTGVGGNGGAGISINFDGTIRNVAGGGGGCANGGSSSNTLGTSATGFGAGATSSSGSAGSNNTGGAGGSANSTGIGSGKGGSGLVIIRYPIFSGT